MGKVIDIFTKKEVTEMPATVQDGEAIIEVLLRLEVKQNNSPFSASAELMSNVITMVENNTGAQRFDVMERIYNRRKA